MKILIVSDYFGLTENPERSRLHNLASEYVRRGHQVRVLARRGAEVMRPRRTPYVLDYYERPSLDVFPVGVVGWLMWRRLLNQVHIAHAFGAGPVGYGAAMFRRLEGAPLVTSPAPEDYLADLDGAAGPRLAPGVDRRKLFALNYTDAVVVATEPMRELLATKAREPARIRVMADGFRPADIEGRSTYIHSRQYVLAEGRLVPAGGFDVLLDAFGAIARSQPNVDLIVAGEGGEKETLMARRAGLGLEGRVEFVGYADRSLRLGLLRGAAAFVSPERSNVLGNHLVEAMALGVPCVATKTSLATSVVEDGLSGLIVPRGAAEPLGRAIAMVLNDSALRGRLAAGAKARSRGFTWEAVAGRYLDLYREVRAEHAAKRVRRKRPR